MIKIFKNKKNFIFLFISVFTIQQLFIQNNLIFNNSLVAEDFKFFIPNLIFGKIWYLKNTIIDTPHFAPHLCGGIPYHADPQSIYYSFIQIIFILFDVPVAIKITFFLLSLIAYVGIYLLLNISFKYDASSSLIGSTLFLFSGFFISRVFTGHLSYTYAALIPVYCFFVIEAARNNNLYINKIFLILSIFILSSFFFVGASPMMLIYIYTIFLIILIYSYASYSFKSLYYLLLSIFFSILLSLSKITYSLYFLNNFPRKIEGTVLNNILDFFYVFFTNLFLAPNPIYFDRHQYNSNKIYISFNELQYSISVLPLLVLFLYIFFKKKNFFNTKEKFFKNKILCSLILFLLFIPIFFLIQIPYFSELLNKIPVFSNTWVRTRWTFIYIIPFIIFTVGMISSLKINNNKIMLLFLFIPIIQIISTYYLINLFFPHKSLLNRSTYNISSLTKFSSSINKTNINNVKIEYVQDKNNFNEMDLNEGFIVNVSKIFCYQPIFGYTLDKLPRENITKGQLYFSRIKHDKKNYNLFNPSCFLFPKENYCKIGDLFNFNDNKRVSDFLNYKSIDFNISKVQKISNFISLITLLNLIIISTVFSIQYLKNKHNKKNSSQ
jgi:hypothetical protein